MPDLPYDPDDPSGWPIEEPPENPFEEPPPPLEEGAIAKQDAEEREKKPTLVDFLRSHLLVTDTLDNVPDPVPLVGTEHLFIDTLNWLIGSPGQGKSFVAIDLAGCIGTGVRWHGHTVRQGRVLYIAAEGVRGVKRRVRAWEAKHGTKMTGVDFLPFPVQSTNGTHWDALVGLATENLYTLIVVDTQARVTVGVEENSNREMGVFVHQAERLRTAAAACTLLVHHTGSGSERGRGATTLDGALTTIMRCEKEHSMIKLKCMKNKDAPEWEPIEFQLVPQVASAVLVATSNMGVDFQSVMTVPMEIMRSAVRWWDTYGPEWQSSGALQEATDMSKPNFAKQRRWLIEHGYAESTGDRSYRYRLTGDPVIPPEDRVQPAVVPEVEPPPAPEALF